MLKKIQWMSVSIILVLIVGCTTSNTQNVELEMPAILEVQVLTSSDNPSVGEEVRIEAVITQAGEIVDDASDVSFEVWEINNDDHEMIVGVYDGEGIYFTNKVFETDGKFNIVAHITAREQHTMPKIELLVGNKAVEVDAEHSQHDNSHIEGKLSIDLKLPNELFVNETLPIEVVVIYEDNLLTNAKVKFEIWTETSTRHEFINAKEKETGVYVSTFKFEKVGKYNIIVHIQNESMHEHIEREAEIVN